jgi:carboxyl-terminal processing protease
MKIKLCALLFLLFITSSLFAQKNDCELIKKTDALLQQKHLYGVKYTYTVYHEILDLFLGNIDPRSSIFTVTDSIALHKAIESATQLCEVYEITQSLIVQRLKFKDSLVASLDLGYIQSPQLNEKFVLPCTFGNVYQKDAKALKLYIQQYYKYIFYKKLFQIKNANLQLDEAKLLASLKAKNASHYKKLATENNTLLQLFLNAISLRFDPHSAVFSTDEKDQWMSGLSREELSFGFDLEFTEDEIFKVASVAPGGAAWNSKQIDEGDVLDQITLSDGKKMLTGIDADKDIYDAIMAVANTSITFSFTKKDGSKITVKLTKAKAEVAENVINGYVFHVRGQKLGYVYLPSFYSSNPFLGSNGSASDLAREILQLKKDSINGLVIDLRDNGGGFVDEALAIAGLFINEGILALKQEKGDKPRYLKDPNRGTVYDGKLILLINNNAASASELLAGTLQKYNRAILVGNTTYGKGSMQQIFPLDSALELKELNKHYVKVTIGKFYMVNKKTHQAIGIQPDIPIASLYDFLGTDKENDMRYALRADSVVKNVELNLLPAIALETLKTKSEARVKAIKWDSQLQLLADSIMFYVCPQNAVTLNQKSIFALETAKEKFFKKLNEVSIVHFESYPVQNTSVYNQFLKNHEMYTKPNEHKKESFKFDYRLYESLNILSDYISQH